MDAETFANDAAADGYLADATEGIKWHHMVYNFDSAASGKNEDITIYIDGRQLPLSAVGGPGHHDRDDRARHQGDEDRHGHAGHAGTSLGRAFIRSRARRDPRRVASTPVPRATERFGTETNPDIHPLSIVAVRLIVSLPA